MLVTRFGEEVIGVCLVEWVSGETGSGRAKRKRAWRGEIRAWTVRLKYRGKGVGSALLEVAVGEARRKGAAGLEFAEGHASEFFSFIHFWGGFLAAASLLLAIGMC